jgi:hypothetical protein
MLHKKLFVERLPLLALYTLAFLSRLVPLLPFGHVGFDPVLHHEFSLALLNGQTSIVVLTQLGEQVTLYYPPLFHMILLSFYLLFPAIDPYLVMKIIVTALGGLQVFPIYYIVKEMTRSITGAMIAAFLAAMALSDFHMMSWGGYANIVAFSFLATLVYVVIKEKAVSTGVVATLLFLTHHLTMLVAIAVLAPYLILRWWETGKLPRCLISLAASMAVAFGAFYWYALFPLFETYTSFAYRYAEYTLRAGWPEMFGVPLLVLTAAGIVLWAYRTKASPTQSEQLLLMWLMWPILLSYAYIFGVQWHSIRWIYFLQLPACVWSGIAASRLGERRLLLAVVLIALAVQWVISMQLYCQAVAFNAV